MSQRSKLYSCFSRFFQVSIPFIPFKYICIQLTPKRLYSLSSSLALSSTLQWRMDYTTTVIISLCNTSHPVPTLRWWSSPHDVVNIFAQQKRLTTHRSTNGVNTEIILLLSADVKYSLTSFQHRTSYPFTFYRVTASSPSLHIISRQKCSRLQF